MCASSQRLEAWCFCVRYAGTSHLGSITASTRAKAARWDYRQEIVFYVCASCTLSASTPTQRIPLKEFFFPLSCLLQGFFRRSIQQNIHYKMCVKNEKCLIMRMNRNRCQHCRFKKCLSVGMSRDGERLLMSSRKILRCLETETDDFFLEMLISCN